MTNEELNQYIDQKWSNYYRGSVAFMLATGKTYTAEDVRAAFESGFYEMLQILYRNNIDVEKLRIE